MAYIDREKFLKKCAEAFGHFGVLVKAIEEISDECVTTADVVPKSEVAREIFEEIESFGLLDGIVAKYKFSELKKKYAEGEA